jgi:hypothetical protein
MAVRGSVRYIKSSGTIKPPYEGSNIVKEEVKVKKLDGFIFSVWKYLATPTQTEHSTADFN